MIRISRTPKAYKLEKRKPEEPTEEKFLIVSEDAIPHHPKFPSLTEIANNFVKENHLPSPVKTTPTQYRGLLVYLGEGGHFLLCEEEDNNTSHYQKDFILDGELRGEPITLSGGFYRKNQKSKTYRNDNNTDYVFLGKKAKPKTDPRKTLLGASPNTWK